ALRFDANPAAQSTLTINEELARQLMAAAKWVQQTSGEGTINPLEVLRWPGVMAAAEQDLDAISAALMAGFEQAMDEFVAAREREGSALKALIEQRLDGVSAQVAIVRSHMPDVLQW
ncbi:MAG TPA: hypothetical protein DCF88_08155, partial [Plesiomonas shigelloides]|nr:hypothetical protein [Plesiomonas shigelloides]